MHVLSICGDTNYQTKAKIRENILVLPFIRHGLVKLEERPYRGLWSTYTLIMINRSIYGITELQDIRLMEACANSIRNRTLIRLLFRLGSYVRRLLTLEEELALMFSLME